jgi:hypothetical protein
MNRTLPILSLLAAFLDPCIASAQPLPDKIGDVTIALTLSYQEGGYRNEDGSPSDSKFTETDTQTKVLLKTVIKKAKYSNKEFLSDLITKGLLTGSASDWSIKYAEIDDYIKGFFAVNKTGQVIYLGGLRVDGDEPIVLQNGAGQIASVSGNQTANYKPGGKITENIKDFGYAYTTDETSTISVVLRPTNDSDNDIETSGLRKSRARLSLKIVAVTEKETLGYTVPASSFTDLVGDSTTEEDNGTIVQGSINISPLKDIEDTSAYEEAYPYEPLHEG